MQKTVLFAILAFALVFAASSAEASNDQYGWTYLFAGQAALVTVDAGPNAVVFTLHDITIEGEPAADARYAIDHFDGVGNGDGQVSDSEVIGIQAIITSAVNSMLPQRFDLEMITIDGMAAFSEENKDVHLEALKIKGAQGAVTSTDPIQTDVKVKVSFDTVDQARTTHTLRFENLYGDFSGYDTSKAPPMEVQVRGYKSWDIVPSSIEPTEFQERLQDDTLTLTQDDVVHFDQEGKGLVFVIEGDPSVKIDDDTKGSPSVGGALVLAAVGALFVALRRH